MIPDAIAVLVAVVALAYAVRTHDRLEELEREIALLRRRGRP